MVLWCRMTKLNDMIGRADYISNKSRQEYLIMTSKPVDWKPYVEYEHLHQKTGRKNNEGRELTIALPNEWYDLSDKELYEQVDALARYAIEKDTDYQWAIHLNKDQTNLHMHLVFSERTKIATPKKYDRDIYLRSDGKIARKKSERAKDKNGIELPPAHYKGESMGDFGPKDPRYHKGNWLSETKDAIADAFREYGAEVSVYDPRTGHLPQQHVGKKLPEETAERIREYNRMVRTYNKLVDREDIPYDESQKIVEEMRHRQEGKNDLLQKILDYYDEQRNSPSRNFDNTES